MFAARNGLPRSPSERTSENSVNRKFAESDKAEGRRTHLLGRSVNRMYDVRNTVEGEEHSVLVHQATHQGGLQVPLQPLERLDPPAQRAPGLRADLEPQLERRCHPRRVADSQSLRVSRT